MSFAKFIACCFVSLLPLRSIVTTVIALYVWGVEPVIPVARVFGANAFFAFLFAATALLFRTAAEKQDASFKT